MPTFFILKFLYIKLEVLMKRWQLILRLVVLIVGMMCIFGSSVFAAVPRQLNYQGYLTDTAGLPVNTTTQMIFKIYSTDTATEPLWQETQSVTPVNGYYSVLLGGTATLSLPFDQQYWLGVTINSDPEMTPRSPLTSVAYALRADTAEMANAVPDGAITLAKLSTAACTSGQVLQKTITGWECASQPVSTSGGTIDGVTAGSGLFGGGTSGNVTLDISFAGSGSALTVARSDHEHDALYAKKYGKTAVVAVTGGDYTSPVAALADLDTWCGAPSATNLCQVRIMAGVFELGSTSLQLTPYVHVRGSGSTTTVLTGALNSLTAGVVNGASHAHISDLAILNSGGTTEQGGAFANAIAVFNSNAAPEIQNVVVEARGALNTYAIYNTASSLLSREVIIRDAILTAGTAAIYNGLNVNTFVRTSRFLGIGGVENLGTMTCSANFSGEQEFFQSSCPGGFDFQVIAVRPGSFGYYGEITGVPTNTAVTATFNRDMDATTLIAANFLLKDGNGSSVAGSVSYDAASRTAAFTPTQPLLPNSFYSATLTADVRDSRGGKYYSDSRPSAYNWQFQTLAVAENSPLTVSSSSPQEGEVVDPAHNRSVSVEFGRQLDPRSLVSSALVLKNAAGISVPGTFSSTLTGISFQPAAMLAYATTYTATVSGVKDLAGNALAAPITWTFSTPGGIAPISVNAVRSGSKIEVSWPAVTGATAYNLYTCSRPEYVGNQYPRTSMDCYQLPVQIANVTSPYLHVGPFSEDTTYFYSIKAVFAGKEGAAGNVASHYYDTSIPTVLSHGNLDVRFSEVMDQATFNNGNFTVRDGAGNLLAGYVSNSYVCDSMGCREGTSFQPATALQAGTTYTVTLSVGIKDQGGNALAEPVSWSFSQPLDVPSMSISRSGLNVTLSWPFVAGATSYNLYWATIPGVTKGNGTKIANVTSPYPHSNLAEGSTYYYVLTAVNGAMESTESYQQSVSIDTTAPTVTSTMPANGATNVSISTGICLNFSEGINSSAWNSTNVMLKDAGNTSLPGFLSTYEYYYDGTTSCYGPSFRPSSALNYNTTYTLSVTGITDNAGNAMTTPYSLSFSTAVVGTPSGLTATSTGRDINLNWSAAPGATGYTIYWSNYGPLSQASAFKISVTGTSYTHANMPDGNYSYLVTASNGTTESAASNQATVTISQSPPVVVSSYPSNNSYIYLDQNISLSFSTAIDPASWIQENVILTDSLGNSVPISVTYSMYSSVILTYPLIPSMTYTLMVSGIKSQSGIAMISPYTLTFSTSSYSSSGPSNVTATAGTSQSTLMWSPMSYPATYNLYWATTPGVTTSTGTKLTNIVPPYLHTGLTTGTTYYYVLTAENPYSGESAASAEVSAIAQ
jgi:fibronectin type 3 domain-containing protein